MRDLTAIFDADRLKVYPRLLLVAYAAAVFGLFAMSTNSVDPTGKPLGYDFITFWSAARLTLEGHAAEVFDFARIYAMQRVAVPGSTELFLWHYPPTYQLAVLPLGLMPYLTAYFAFMALSLAAFVAALRPLVRWREAGILLLALPGTFVCFLHGQNSLVSAALLATAIIALDRKPLLAGICIGLLAYKPQLGVLFPLALLVTGRWRAMIAAGMTVISFAGLATLVLGPEQWAIFFRNLDIARQVTEGGQLPWGKMPSAFVFLRKLGIGQSAAYAGQTLVALTAIAITTLVWWRARSTLLAGATLVSGTLLLTPYTFDYEMAILAIPLAIIARQLIRHGASSAEKLMLLAIAATPMCMGTPIEKMGVQIGFLALVATFAWSARLALATGLADRHVIPAWLTGHSLLRTRQAAG